MDLRRAEVPVMKRSIALTAMLALAGCIGASQSLPPSNPSSGAPATAHLGYTVSEFTYHVMPLRTQAPHPGANTRILYPADLTDSGGPIMKTAAAYNLYVNCPAANESCWGDPEGFQKSLTGSSFAKLLTQYTRSPASSYTLAGSSAVTYKTFTGVYFDNDLFTILHSAIAGGKLPTGFSHLYHIFLPKGAWTCFDGTRSCYSPGRNGTFAFCAYHAYVRFSDIGLVVYSVEPYQNVSGCASKASAGASALTNSTASTLGHETFESITDPGQKFAWFNFTFDEEVADLCETYEWNITVGGTKYSIQPMYSNKYHACADGP
jgi:hypothetical protein